MAGDGLVVASSGRILLASCLPSSTPHWSKLKMFQIAPCTKILCSYAGDQGSRGFRVSCLNRMLLVGRLPSNTFGTAPDPDLLQRLAGGQELGFHRFLALAEGQCLGLGEEVRQQFRMVIADGVVADGRRQEVAGDQLGAPVDQLVEGVLAVGARLTPDDGAGLVVDRVAVAIHVLAVGLHVALLEVGGKRCMY